MTAITKDQIRQEIFSWNNMSRGFHGGRFDSSEICVFDEAGETAVLDFSLREYTSGLEDSLGITLSRWRIILFIKEGRCVPGAANLSEYAIEFPVEVGIDYADKKSAMDFCEYILASYLEHQNLSRLPYTNFHPSEV